MEIHKLDLIVGHRQKCQYIPQPCPVNKLNLGTCTWTGISSGMTSHLKQAHNDMCIDYYGSGSFYNRGAFPINGVTPDTKYCKLILYGNNVLYSRSEIQNGILYSVLQYVGPVAEAAKYQYKLDFFNKDRTESLAVTVLARSWDEDLSEVYNSGKCVKLYPEQFNRFANERRELSFSMEIVAVGHNHPHVYI
jgi:hypothetical protein